MILKEQLIEYFSKNNQAIGVASLIRKFHIEHKNLNSFLKILNELEEEGVIMFDEHKNYIPISKDSCFKHGVIKLSNRGNYYIELENGKRINVKEINKKRIRPGNSVFIEMKPKLFSQKKKHKDYEEGTVCRKVGESEVSLPGGLFKAEVKRDYESKGCYVVINEQKIHISNKHLNSAYPGDIVTVYYENKGKNSTSKVIDILKRKYPDHVFECHEVHGKKEWVPIGTAPFPIKLKPSSNTSIGTRVLATILEKENQEYNIRIQKSLKSKTKLELEIESTLLEYCFHYGFSKDVQKEALEIPTPLIEEELQNRKDLRDLETFTIDSVNAKDLDDAISLEKIGDHYRLYIHIADVSHYVKPQSNVFKEALYRGVSVYPANYVEPMLDTRLSNELCSLNPGEDKLTKTCMIELDQDGQILGYDVFKSIIRSDYKMSYHKVDEFLELGMIDEEYLPYEKTLTQMYLLALILQKQRLSNGVLAFTNEELCFDTDEYGRAISINERKKGPGSIIIENFMILGNSIIADYAYWMNIPFVYRNHESPTVIKLSRLEDRLLSISNLSNKITNTPKALQNLFLSLIKGKNKDQVKYISEIFLKAMMKAFYSKDNIGHYGLGLQHYGTFTSPIRKASDLLNHMFLDEVLEHGMHNPKLDPIKEELERICEHISIRQYESEQVEKEINLKLFQEYASRFIGIPLEARITFLSEEGIFIKTQENVSGYIPLNKAFTFDKEKGIVINKKSHEKYCIGNSIEVVMKSKKSTNFMIEFDMFKEKIQEKNENNKVLVKKEGKI